MADEARRIAPEVFYPQIEDVEDVDIFNQYMLTQLQAANESMTNTQSKVDQSIQLFMTIASAASGLFILTITSGQPMHVVLGSLAVAMLTLGAVGSATFLRIARWRFDSERELALRNQIHRYFGSRHPRYFKYFGCGYNMVFFQTSTWKRSIKDRSFLLTFGLGNAALFAVGVPLVLTAAILGATNLSISANLWWIISLGVALVVVAIILAFRAYNKLFKESGWYIEQIWPASLRTSWQAAGDE